jgi:hypothetical protein
MDDDTKALLAAVASAMERMAAGIERLLLLMTGSVAVSPEDVAAIGRTAMPGMSGGDGSRITMTHGGQQYVRENVGDGRWLKYAIGANGEILNPQIELANGERVSVDLG